MEVKAFFLFFVSALLLGHETLAAMITLFNSCPYTVWPATITVSRGPQLSVTGFALQTDSSNTLVVDAPWAGRIWGRTGCSTNASGKFFCETADCGTGRVKCEGRGPILPATLAEFTLFPAESLVKEKYHVSLVYGFNVPMSITPIGLPGNLAPESFCVNNVNMYCPPELSVHGKDGSVVACKSACLAFRSPRFCCTGKYNSPRRCLPSIYSKVFKDHCLEAFSYPYDTNHTFFMSDPGVNYFINFCA